MRRLGIVLLVILFLFMVFAGPAAPKADAVVVSTVVIGAVIAAMAAAGIGLTVSGMTSAQLQDWVSGKLNNWATSLGGTVQDYIDGSDISVSGRGFLSLGTLAAKSISQFISWLQTEDSIADNSTITAVASTSTLNGKKIVKLPTVVMTSGNSTFQWGPINSTDEIYAYYRENIGVQIFTMNSNIRQCYAWYNGSRQTWNIDSSRNGYRYSSTQWGVGTWNNYYPGTTYNGLPYDVFGTATAPTVTGSIDYTSGSIIIPTIGATDKWFIDVGADPGVTVETVTDGVIADTIDGTLTVSGEVAEEEPEIEIDGPIGVSGLTEVFPFCIPFDVYDLLSCLSDDPQTPIFTVRFVIPGIINEEFTIDLTPFNAVAQIVRTMELIAFAIGLALVTRERFLRS